MDEAKGGGERLARTDEGRSFVLPVVLVLTIAWMVGVSVAVFYAGIDDGFSRTDFWGRLGAMQPSEVGDLLAGLFAPPAFLWVVATVFIQSKELRAQRQEIRDNREVASAQRDAMLQQAEESKEQTRLLRAEANDRESRRIDEICSAILDALATHITSRGLSELWYTDKMGQGQMAMHFVPDSKLSSHAILFQFAGQVQLALESIEGLGGVPQENRAVNYFSHDVAVLLRYLEGASEPFKIRVRELNLNAVADMLGAWWSPNAPPVSFLQHVPKEWPAETN